MYCDIELNRLVLAFMRVRGAAGKMTRYAQLSNSHLDGRKLVTA